MTLLYKARRRGGRFCFLNKRLFILLRSRWLPRRNIKLNVSPAKAFLCPGSRKRKSSHKAQKWTTRMINGEQNKFIIFAWPNSENQQDYSFRKEKSLLLCVLCHHLCHTDKMTKNHNTRVQKSNYTRTCFSSSSSLFSCLSLSSFGRPNIFLLIYILAKGI